MTYPESPIGRAIATESNPATTSSVRFWLESEVQLKPFDIVRILPPKESSHSVGEYYAIVREIERVSDEVSPLTGYLSADFGDPAIEPRVSRITTTYADAQILFNSLDNEMPVPHNSEVHWPEEAGVRRALGIDEFQRRIPAGFITMSGPNNKPMTIPIDIDADYLLGPEGAHLNISGISGLATKTSYAMFLMTGIQQRQAVDPEWSAGSDVSFIILNVKGSDLLRVHQEADELSDETSANWKKCELSAQPLQDVMYFYPYSSTETQGYAETKLDGATVCENVDTGRAHRFYYDLDSALSRLGLLVEDMDDPNHTLVSCMEYCLSNASSYSTWKGFRDKVREWATKTPDPKIPVVSWRRFARLVTQRTKNPIFTEKGIKADERKQVPLADLLKYLGPNRAVVVDIARLPDYVQSFVVGDIIEMLRNAKLGAESDENDDSVIDSDIAESVVIFADELNKFAPTHHASRSITKHLREISERGRSEGIVLFGAEQFRTGVDDRVTGNSGTQVFGRTTAVEAGRDREIKELPGRQGSRVPFLKKGELMVSHTRFSAGTLKLRFPRNAYRSG